MGSSGHLVVLTRSGSVYAWGSNEMGQLGQGDCMQRSTPHRLEALEGKRVTSVACGKDFVIALGLTMPMKETNAGSAQASKFLTQSKGERSDSRGRKKTKPPTKRDYDTLNSNGDRCHSSSNRAGFSKMSHRKKSKSAQKQGSLNNTGVYSVEQRHADGHPYTPLRCSPPKSRSHSKRKSSKSGGNVSKTIPNDLSDYKAPSMIHE